MYSQHALQRMQQRGISKYVVEALLTFGCSHYHKGREVIFLDHHSLARLDRSGVWSWQTCQQLRRHYLVLQGGRADHGGPSHDSLQAGSTLSRSRGC